MVASTMAHSSDSLLQTGDVSTIRPLSSEGEWLNCHRQSSRTSSHSFNPNIRRCLFRSGPAFARVSSPGAKTAAVFGGAEGSAATAVALTSVAVSCRLGSRRKASRGHVTAAFGLYRLVRLVMQDYSKENVPGCSEYEKRHSDSLKLA